jgi:hypothetical protein
MSARGLAPKDGTTVHFGARRGRTAPGVGGVRPADPLPITHRVDGDMQHSNGTSVGAPVASGLAQTAQGINVPDTDGILAPHTCERILRLQG